MAKGWFYYFNKSSEALNCLTKMISKQVGNLWSEKGAAVKTNRHISSVSVNKKMAPQAPKDRCACLNISAIMNDGDPSSVKTHVLAGNKNDRLIHGENLVFRSNIVADVSRARILGKCRF